MNRIAVLCEKDRTTLREFSRRCTERLKADVFFKLVLPLAGEFLEANVEKEIRKDRLAIEYAGSLFVSGEPLHERDVEKQFERTKAVDRDFLAALPAPLASLRVDYDRFAPVRKRRLHLVISTVLALLGAWTGVHGFREAVAETFAESKFREILTLFFHLYVEEVKILGATGIASLPARLGAETVLTTLFSVMEETSNELIDDCIGEIYG